MNKINIFFDIKFILESYFSKSYMRSGLFFVCWNVLKNMRKNEALNITLAYPLEIGIFNGLRKLKRDEYFSKFNYVCTGITGVNINSNQQNIEKHKNSKRYTRMIYNYIKLLKFKINEKLYYNKKALKKAHIYLSPCYAIPQNILKQEHIIKFYILYDIIPALFPERFNGHWFFQIPNSIDRNTYSFCISQSCKDDFLKYYSDKFDQNKMFVTYIATNQNYIPNYDKQKLIEILKKYNIEYNINNKYLFSLCSLEPRKNLLFTITCFLKFIKKHNIHDLYFYLGGEFWESFRPVMEKTLEEAGEFKYKIKLLGYVDDSDINLLYSNSLFFTCLSQYEGFGMPPLEAMQAGTPVIASNNSSIPEVVGDAAISLTYNDEEAVIKAFENFYFNESLRKEYIAKGLERAKMFSWEKCVGKMIEIIEEVVK